MFRSLIFPTVQIALLSAAAMAQQPIGSVGVQDATVSGALEVTNGRAMLVGSTAITAKDHTAEIALTRGGTVRVCSTSELHLSAGKPAPDAQSLMLALDRGAIELQTAATANDFVLTPDLRFAVSNSGPLDLRLRVTRNGDTCAENRGANAPTIHIADQFGETSYDLRAGQHVLFEHGSLKEVVDSETSPCGCPPDPAVLSIADAALAPTGGTITAKQTETESEAQHPFPAAVSQGLAPPTPEPPAAQPGEIHQQVAATLSYGANATPDSTATAPSSTPAASAAIGSAPRTAAASPATTAIAQPKPSAPPPAVATQATPPATQPPNDLVHRIGHFFKRLFGKA
jgi:hypothetical protein